MTTNSKLRSFLYSTITLILFVSLFTSCGSKNDTQHPHKNSKLLQKSAKLAGDRTGSGGDALVCLNDEGEIESVELWDYVEGKALENLNVDLGPDTLTTIEKFDLYLTRLAQYDNELSESIKYFRRYAEYIAKSESSPDGFISFIQANNTFRLKDIKDATMVIELHGKKNCEIWQIARQIKNPSPVTSMIQIDPRLTQKMSKDHLVGLIMHEFMV